MTSLIHISHLFCKQVGWSRESMYIIDYVHEYSEGIVLNYLECAGKSSVSLTLSSILLPGKFEYQLTSITYIYIIMLASLITKGSFSTYGMASFLLSCLTTIREGILYEVCSADPHLGNPLRRGNYCRFSILD